MSSPGYHRVSDSVRLPLLTRVLLWRTQASARRSGPPFSLADLPQWQLRRDYVVIQVDSTLPGGLLTLAAANTSMALPMRKKNPKKCGAGCPKPLMKFCRTLHKTFDGYGFSCFSS